MTYPAPEQRVRDFLDAFETDPLPRDLIADALARSLTVSDLRDVLNELDEHRTRYDEAVTLLSQIDEVLDVRDALGAKAGEAIAKLLGNNSSREARMTMAAQLVLAMPGTITETDRRNAAIRLAELALGLTDKEGQ